MSNQHTVPGAAIALIGAGCRFPGGVRDLETFDRLLRGGVDAVREIPPERWSTLAFASDTPGVPGKTYSRWGGFLDDIDQFEPEAFGISAREAAVMDPQQRLLLEVAWEAIADAGIPLRELAGTRTGVFVGISTFDYSHLQSGPTSKRSLQPLTALGTSLSIAANRISYCLDARGPSFIVDTACSSSLVALDRAVRSLRSGECETAIVGGVNALLLPEIFISFSAASMLSPEGRCKAFDASANGFVRAEGAAALVLRMADTARSRSDRVHACILGSGINQDGRTAGLAMPNGKAQERLLRETYQQLGIHPGAVGYIEAHGTGTAVGDPTEADAIGRVIGAAREPSHPLPIGSVKTNLGHLEAASGMAGVLKAVLTLKHRTIYPNLHFQTPNPRIPFGSLRLRVPVQTEPWPGPPGVAIAGVNSFGFGGTNAHVVLAEPTAEWEATRNVSPPRAAGQSQATGRYILPVTARHAAALAELAAAFRDRLSGCGPAELMAACCTAAKRRTHYPHRLCVTGETPGELLARLDSFIEGQPSAGVSTGTVRAGVQPVVFVFSGQGPQFPRMGLDLFGKEPVFRDAVRECDEQLQLTLGWSVLEEIERPAETSRIDDTHVAQPALFAVQAGLAALWRSWGVTPSAVIGHSVGEVAAAWISGALDLETACRVVAIRSRAMQEAPAGGKMLAAALTPEDAIRRLRNFGGDVSLAAVNGPRQVTLSGDAEAVAALARDLDRESIWNRFLRVSHAFHSSDMDVAEGPLRSGLAGLPGSEPRLRWISTVTGRAMTKDDLTADYWWRNVRQPVLLASAVRAVLQDAQPVFLEIAPHPALSSSLMECARAQQSRTDVWPSMRRDAPAEPVILGTLGGLFTSGVPVAWDAILPAAAPPVELPPHPWYRQRYWHQNADVGPTLVARDFHPLLGFRRTAGVPTWGQTLDHKVFPWLADHRLKGTPVFPAAAYIELMLAALGGTEAAERSIQVNLDNVQFQRALFLSGESLPELQVTASGEDHSVNIHSSANAAQEHPWVRNAAAGWSTVAAVRPEGVDLNALRRRLPEQVSTAETYARLASLGLEYGPLFQTHREVWKGDGEALGHISVEPSIAASTQVWWWHPTLLDGCFQVCAIAAEKGAGGVLMVPVRADHVRVWDRGGADVWCHVRLQRATEWAVVADLRMYRSDGSPVAEVLGFRCQRVAGGNKAAIARGPRAYVKHWESRPLAGPEPAKDGAAVQVDRRNGFHPHNGVPPQSAPADPPRVWVLFAEPDRLTGAVAARLSNIGSHVILVQPGARFGGDAALGFRLNPSEPAQWRQLLEALPPEAVHAGFVHFGSAAGGEDFARETELEVPGGVWLAQALARRDTPPGGKFVLVTRDAQWLDGDPGPCRAGAAGLLGLGRVLCNEFPAWTVKLIDMPADFGPADLDGLVASLLSDDSETESAWRAGQRFVPRIQEGPALDVQRLTAAQARAFRLEAGHGSAVDALEWIAAERQAPGPGEIEIRVRHAALNFRDVLKSVGMYPADDPQDLLLGDECAGEIVAMGPSVTGFRVGDQVLACGQGCFRSHVIVPAEMALPVLPGWSLDEAATIPIAFLTAWYALRTVGQLASGDSVLIHAAAGGVGMAAVQIAQLVGARIFATAGTEEKREMLAKMGCELVMDSRSLAFADEVRVHTDGRGADVVLNSLAGEALRQSLTCVAPYGRFLELGKRDLFANAMFGLWPLRQNGSFHAIDLGAVLREKPALARTLWSEVKTALGRGALRPLPHQVWPAARVAEAFRTMSQGKHTGKLVVDLRDPGIEILSRDVPRVSFRQDASYVITGGLGGFGLETAKWIVRRGGKHVVLLSRRAADAPGVRDAAEELRRLGGEPLVISCDVADRRDVAAAFKSLRATMPPVRGLFHAAAVIDDASIADLDPQRLQAVLRPKALGAWNLHEEARELELDHFVLYSSVSASIGNIRQASYAAANAMIEGLAAYRRSQGLPATAIGWGVVSEAGFAAQRPELMKHLERHGFHGTPPASYLELLERLLASGCTSAIAGDFDWRAVARAFQRPGGLMASLLDRSDAGLPGGTGSAALREQLEEASFADRPSILQNYLRTQAARILGVPAGKLDPECSLVDLGLDSLMGIELAAVLESNLATTLPAMTAAPDLTIVRLAKDILRQMGLACPESGSIEPPGLRESTFSFIVPLRAGGTRPPLICFHPAGGSVRVYEALTEALDPSIPVYGVQSRMLAGADEFPDLNAMIEAYTGEVRAFWPDGPYRLFGYSLGGYLAAGVAQRLEGAGGEAAFVGIADGPDCGTEAAADAQFHLARLISSSYQEAAADLPYLRPLDGSEAEKRSVQRVAEALLERHGDGAELFLAWLRESQRLAPGSPMEMIRAHLRRLARHLLLVGTSLEVPVVGGPLFLWRAAQGVGAGSHVWRRAGDLPVSVTVIEADHAGLMNPPAVAQIAEKINHVYRGESSAVTYLLS